jgi:hypothetical protein
VIGRVSAAVFGCAARDGRFGDEDFLLRITDGSGPDPATLRGAPRAVNAVRPHGGRDRASTGATQVNRSVCAAGKTRARRRRPRPIAIDPCTDFRGRANDRDEQDECAPSLVAGLSKALLESAVPVTSDGARPCR